MSCQHFNSYTGIGYILPTIGGYMSVGGFLPKGPTVRGPIGHAEKVDSWAPESWAPGHNCPGPSYPLFRGLIVQGPTVRGPTVRGKTVWGPICLEQYLWCPLCSWLYNESFCRTTCVMWNLWDFCSHPCLFLCHGPCFGRTPSMW